MLSDYINLAKTEWQFFADYWYIWLVVLALAVVIVVGSRRL